MVLPFCLQADEVEMRKRGPKMRRVLHRSKLQCEMLGVTDLLQPDKTLLLLLRLLHLFRVLAQLFCCPEVLKPSASQRVVRTGELHPSPLKGDWEGRGVLVMGIPGQNQP